MDAKKIGVSIKSKILLGFGSAITILLVTGLITYQSFNELMRSVDFLSTPELKLAKLNDILSDLSSSENHIRYYFLSRNKKYLDTYERYSNALDKNIDSLTKAEDHGYDKSNIENVKTLWQKKKKHTIELLKLYKKKKKEATVTNRMLRKFDKKSINSTILITKVITIKTKEPYYSHEADKKEKGAEDKRSLFSKLFKKKEKEDVPVDSSAAPASVVEETQVTFDTIVTSNKNLPSNIENFTKIFNQVQNKNSRSRQLLESKEAKIIQQDLQLIKNIRAIVIGLKNKEQQATEAKIVASRRIVQTSLLKILLFGISGIAVILLFGFIISDDIKKSNYQKNQLMNAKAQAEALATAKQNFLATMSHEIRTPLNSIYGFSEQLSQTQLHNKQKYFLQAITNSTNHLLSIVNDILDISRIEAGKIDLEEIPFQLHEVIEEVYSVLYLKAEEKSLLFTYLLEMEKICVVGDPFRLKQILFNLVSNAIKFTESGSVTIKCSTLELDDDFVKASISINDTGIGISSEKLESIFESFSQADSSITRKFGGTGLGLAISKKLIELQKGHITVKSEEGKGSEFTFDICYKISRDGLAVTAEEAVPDIGFMEGISVLVVEDDEFNLLLFHTILNKWKMKACIVSSGEEALQALKENSFDLVLTDIHMPGISGIDLLEKIKSDAQKRISHLPVVAVTANVIKKQLDTYKGFGFDELLLKPFTEEQLAKTIIKVTGRHFKNDSQITENSLPEKEIVVSNPGILTDFIEIANGNAATFYQMVESFISNCCNLLRSMEIHTQQENWKELKEAAHRLIPGFGYVNNYEIVNLLQELENTIELVGYSEKRKIVRLAEKIITKGYKQIEVLKEEKSKLTVELK